MEGWTTITTKQTIIESALPTLIADHRSQRSSGVISTIKNSQLLSDINEKRTHHNPGLRAATANRGIISFENKNARRKKKSELANQKSTEMKP